MSADTANKKQYKAESIRIMEGLEAVRKRPAMYIGSTGVKGLHHLVYEVVDNSVDESLAGHCSNITVTLHTDGSCSVEDDGRGIPTGIHPTEKISATEVVLTKLHAGGKFDKDSYKYSGGLHGVGISVVNALSTDLTVTVFQNEKIYTQSYKRGVPQTSLDVIGTTKKRGTLIRFTPDPKIFQDTTTFSFDTLAARLRELAFLNKKLRISIEDEADNQKNEFYFEGGIISFVEHINNKKSPLLPSVLNFENSDDQYILEIAFQYNDGYGEQLFSFVNNINTVEGGTHVAGFKSALTKEYNKRAQKMNILKEGESFSSDDVREGIVAVISIKVPEPQFEGQTKTKLGNSEVKGLVDSWTSSYLQQFFEENPVIAKKLFQKAETAKRARDAAKKARDLTRRKTALESVILPGKLADCTNENPSDTELFIVEGESAGGSAKQGRDRNNQAILPLKGKILNVEKARLDRMLSNDEIKALISAIGCGIGAEFDVEKARYHKIIIMTDADVDGAHIKTLLLTFFFRYMKPLIESGYLYIAQPPLYKAKIGKKEEYLKNENSLKQFLFAWAKEHTTLSIGKKSVEADQWHTLLNDLLYYDLKIQELGYHFKITDLHSHQLVTALHASPWKKEDGLERLLTLLQKQFADYSITIETPEPEEASDETQEPVTHDPYVQFNVLNKTWKVGLAFFSSPKTAEVLTLVKPITILSDGQWTLHVTAKDKSVTGTGVMQFMNAMEETSKQYLRIQRYKGLGEMNPEQLWETSMDPKVRTLLKADIEDELNSDLWFTTLMGDDVAGRKDYIEEYGHFVKNLDI